MGLIKNNDNSREEIFCSIYHKLIFYFYLQETELHKADRNGIRLSIVHH